MAPSKPQQVQPGQVWRDNDTRAVYPNLEVISVDHRRGIAIVRRRPDRLTKVRCDRLLGASNARGYTYVGEAD